MQDLEIMCEKLNAGTWPHFQLDVHGRAWRRDSAGGEWYEVRIFQAIEEAKSIRVDLDATVDGK